MGNFNQTERINKLTTTIQQELAKQEDILMQVEDCYFGYLQLTAYFKEEQMTALHPMAKAILEIVQSGAVIQVAKVAALFCVDESIVYEALKQLQQRYSIVLNTGGCITKIEPVAEANITVYTQSLIINPKMRKVIEFEPDYSISSNQIVSNEAVLTRSDVLKLFPHIKENQLVDWFSHQVAGPHMFKVTIYNQIEKVKRVVLYNDEGQQLYEVEREAVDLTDVLIENLQPKAIISYEEGMTTLQGDTNWMIAVQDEVTEDVLAFLRQVSAPTLVLLNEKLPSEQIKTLDIIEKHSRGLLTVIQSKHPFDLLCISEARVLQKITKNQLALYTDSLFIQTKQQQIQQLLIELATAFETPDALKSFIYLIEQKVDEQTLQQIFSDFSETWSSDGLMHRGKILDNHGYKKLAKEVYDLGIKVHAQEVNL